MLQLKNNKKETNKRQTNKTADWVFLHVVLDCNVHVMYYIVTFTAFSLSSLVLQYSQMRSCHSGINLYVYNHYSLIFSGPADLSKESGTLKGQELKQSKQQSCSNVEHENMCQFVHFMPNYEAVNNKYIDLDH